MDVTVLFLILGLLTFMEKPVEAGFFYNPLPPNSEQIKERGLKCVPGRTVIKIDQEEIDKNDGSDETRRSHMNTNTKDDSCTICVCSTEGKDEYCSKRPARNVNECVKMSLLKKQLEKNMPFEHERSLAFRIRRDYIWHYDEIPYEARASCKRSTSYYSNSVTANDTDIDVASDIDSLLDYSNKAICFYCVCSVDGKHAGCISRDPWFCEYYRLIRNPEAGKNKYRNLFQQDRPPYFRHLSYRLRRTMDEGIVTFYDAVGLDTLNNSKCVPFVSEYSDCTEANYCSGCNRCRCSEDGEWLCERVLECPMHDNDDDINSNQNTLTSALDVLYSGLKEREKKKHRTLVPSPPVPEDDLIVSGSNPYEEDFETYLSRQKRSIKGDSADKMERNRTITFFHTVDDINEDTLKNSNKSGTIEAKKVETNRIPKLSRRTGIFDNFNKSALSSLHIEYNQPSDYDHHIAENKIDTVSNVRKKLDENELKELLGNYSQKTKDRDLSKLVVNELKVGNELIGDKTVTPTSNVTFTPENDTLTAMAFIAGNLLSKLWDMEKDPIDDSIEAEVLKHEKINDLIDLFKEPLSIRQETFLKNALEKLSDTLNKNKSIKNVSICETITDSDYRHLSEDELIKDDVSGLRVNNTKCVNSSEPKHKMNEAEHNPNITSNVISKLSNVIALIKKFEGVEKNLNDLKLALPTEQLITKENIDDDLSFQLFGNLLDKITKLLTPKKNKSKKMTNRLRNSYQFTNKKNITNIFGKKLNIVFDIVDLSTKDKLILDYLNHIESNPNCLLKSKHLQMKNLNKNNNPSINSEGNIYDKLSEFMKVKSYIDILRLSKLENSTVNNTHSSTELPGEISTLGNSFRKDINTKLNNTKENLKSHLKVIIDDLLQLQQESGINNTKKVNIIDALPCIYNILNSDTRSNDEIQIRKMNIIQNPHLNKMKALIDTFKMEFSTSLPTRRNNYISKERPKSVQVWERMIKNINSLQGQTRRNFQPQKIKSYEELRNIMEGVESMGNTYKNFAMLTIVPPHKRLMLLKTLEADIKQQARALTNINHSLDVIDKLPLDKQQDIREFIDNVENNILLSSKVLNYLDKSNSYNKKSEVEILVTRTDKVLNKSKLNFPKPLVLSKEMENYRNDNVKLNRYQILNQLMMNRVKVYLNSKEEKGLNLSDDINYNIGKRILLLIQNGSLNIAKELFKIFIANKQKEETQKGLLELPNAVNIQRKRPQLLLALKEPLIRIDGPGREIEVGTGDHFLNNVKL